jgi:addiction module HigA family antidote
LPKNPFHPGEILLEEFLTPGNMTQAALAHKLGWTRARLNELIKGKRDMTAESALDLARMTKGVSMTKGVRHDKRCQEPLIGPPLRSGGRPLALRERQTITFTK